MHVNRLNVCFQDNVIIYNELPVHERNGSNPLGSKRTK